MSDVFKMGKDYCLFYQTNSVGPVWQLIAALTVNSFDLTPKMADTSNKDNAGWNSELPVKLSWKLTGSAISVTPQGTPAPIGFDLLAGDFVASTLVVLKWGKATPVTGDVIYVGSAYISNLSEKAPNEDKVTFDVTFTGVGAIVATVTA